MKIKKATPLFVVDAIEPCLPTWFGIGFEKTVEVPHGDHAGFVILVQGDREVMLQTKASVAADLGIAGVEPAAALYCDVDSIEDARAASAGARVLIAERTTAYGARECWILDAGGTLIGFAEHG